MFRFWVAAASLQMCWESKQLSDAEELLSVEMCYWCVQIHQFVEFGFIGYINQNQDSI